MAIDTSTPLSHGWWLVRLMGRLQAERPDIDRLAKYFKGDHPLPEGADGMKKAYQDFQRLSRSNYLALVVEATLERMRLVGFRTGSEGSDAGDKETWDLWQEARLDATQSQVYRTMLSLRRAYVIVGPHPRKPGKVLITPEHPTQVTTIPYPDDRRTAQAALKVWTDETTGEARATVYLPTEIVRFRSKRAATSVPSIYSPTSLREWELISVTRNSYGVVPVVEFANRPDILGESRAEFEDVIDVQDRINVTLLHRLVAEKFGAFRQKAILNMEFEEDDDGETVTPRLPANPAEAWLLQGTDLRLYEFSQTDTAQIINAVATDIRDLAAITRTPPHYLLSAIVNASGDALKSAETGLTSKVKEHNGEVGEQWEIVMGIAHLVKGNAARAEAFDTEAIFADPESRTLSELYDAAVKGQAAGVPWRARMTLLGFSPQEIRRMETERTSDALLASLTAPPAPTPPTPTAPSQGPLEQDEGTEEDAA